MKTSILTVLALFFVQFAHGADLRGDCQKAYTKAFNTSQKIQNDPTIGEQYLKEAKAAMVACIAYYSADDRDAAIMLRAGAKVCTTRNEQNAPEGGAMCRVKLLNILSDNDLLLLP